MLIVYPMHNFFRREQRYAPFDYNWPIFIQLDPIHQRKFINWNSDSIKQRIINSCKVLFLTVFPSKGLNRKRYNAIVSLVFLEEIYIISKFL